MALKAVIKQAMVFSTEQKSRKIKQDHFMTMVEHKPSVIMPEYNTKRRILCCRKNNQTVPSVT